MDAAIQHRGHRLVERRAPRGHAVYRWPERYADASVSDLVRALAGEGWSRAEISTVTGIRYQQVRNALEERRARVSPDPMAVAPSAADRVEVGAVGSRIAFADLVAQVERGQEIQILRDGEVVARLGPAAAPTVDDRVAAACRRMDELAEQATLGDTTIRELIDEGRRH